jgi:3'-phosphoadenosine 5'-phosphosulfate sulfotransferase (PAPS reductase)/FAD synthetase
MEINMNKQKEDKDKKNIVIAFSGGRTSGYMTKYLVDNYSHKYNFIIIFANTGQEHEETLKFINNCDKHFNFNTIWVEAVVHHGLRKANSHKIVTYETASRNGEPFEEIIKKHGIPNQAFPMCTRELKLSPINSYLRSINLKPKDYSTAIGIRADETRRVRKDATKVKIIYPLVEQDITKEDVIEWWKTQKFDLNIEEHQGNCKWCWKKSTKKHFINLKENPDWYDFPEQMELLYPRVGPEFKKIDFIAKDRTFFRGNVSTKQLKELYKLSMGNLLPIDNLESGGCSESCEFLPTE